MNISILTDEELCMLEQLTYLSEDVAEMASNLDAGFKINFYRINNENKYSTILKIYFQ